MAPDGWRRVHLSEVADQRTKKTVPAETDRRPYIALEHLAQGSPALLGWSKAGTAVSAKTAFRAGDVLFGKLRPYLRKAAPAPFDGLCSTDILPLFGRDTLETCYLAQLAQWDSLIRHAIATSSGTKMPRTSWAQLGEFQFSLPPVPEQRKIAAILSSVDDAIEKTQAVIDQVQFVKRGLMQELLTRGVTADGRVRPPQEKAPQLYKESPLGWIPTGWETALLDDIATRGSGHTPNKKYPDYWNGTIKWVSLADSWRLDRVHISDTDRKTTQAGIDGSSAVLHPAGIVVLSRDAGVGKSAITTCEMAVSQHFMCWECGPQLSNYYLYYWLQYRRREFERIATGSTIPTIGLRFFRHYRLNVPVDIREQEIIAASLLAADQRVFRLENELQALRKVRLALMFVLLVGELRVIPDLEDHDREDRRLC